jgi:predicted transcriptional regulator
MGDTLSLRVPEDLAKWLDRVARKSGVSKSQIIRQELERARAADVQPFMSLAGIISGQGNLSSRKGFSRK